MPINKKKKRSADTSVVYTGSILLAYDWKLKRINVNNDLGAPVREAHRFAFH